MDRAEKAYLAAESIISTAIEEKTEIINFNISETKYLEKIPSIISMLNSLRDLNLDNTSITDLKPISTLPNLHELSLVNTPIQDISPLVGVTTLKRLNISGTRITNLNEVGKLKSLTALNAQALNISDLSPVSNLPDLIVLWIDKTKVTDLSPLSRSRDLAFLSCDNTGVFDLSPLSELPDLSCLYVRNTLVEDLSPISTTRTLETLWIDGSKVKDITPISDLKISYLSIKNTDIHNLNSLREMESLISLEIDGTPVKDLHPISKLKSLKKLSLNNSEVYDLSPLSKKNSVLLDHDSAELQFKNCAATRRDDKLKQISEIDDETSRATALSEYLVDIEISPDPLISIRDNDDRLEISLTTPSEAEVEERLKQLLYKQLREKSFELAQAAGNRFPKTAARARLLQKQLEPEFADSDLLSLHLSIEDLRTLYDVGAEEENEPFPEELIIPLSDVISRGPGLTLGNELVDTLVERANRRRISGAEPDNIKTSQDAMSLAVVNEKSAIGDRLKALEEQVLQSRSAEASEVQQAANRSVLWKIAASTLSVSGGAAGGIAIEAAFGPNITSFVHNNLPVLIEASATYGPSFKGWFVSVMSQFLNIEQIILRYKFLQKNN